MVKRVAQAPVSDEERDGSIISSEKPTSDTPNPEAKKRFKTKSLYRQPTVNELNRLQETETLFNSNLFRLQVEEVLQEVKLSEKTVKKFEEWFNKLKSHLLSIAEDNKEFDLSEQTLSKHIKVKLPIISELQKTKCVFKFHKFANVELVGSYALDCPINSKLRVDIQITVPAETYTKNDSINYRYHKKRAAYLAYIAAHLNKFDAVEELNYSWVNGSETKPVIDIKPAGKLGNHLAVRMNLACDEEAYKLHRFSPSRNNLRESWVFDQSENNDIGPPTPYYNSSILSDLTGKANQRFLSENLKNCENLKQAIVLLKIWLRQRNLQVSGHIVSMLVCYLVQTKRINNIMSSYQIVRNVWIALKTSHWDTKGYSLHKEGPSPAIEEFHQHFPIVFIDVTGYYNICWQMGTGVYNALKRECTLAIEMLDNSNINSFIPLFMTPVKPLMLFDHIIRFKNLPQLKSTVSSKASKESRINYGVNELALVTDTLYSLLAKGLGDRVELILPLVEAELSWSVKKRVDKARENGYKEKLSFGLILNPETFMNIVEKGPSANLPEAEEFRAFWGDKSELRRFQDGSITETCVWEADTMMEKRTITKQIVDYLLQLKYDIPPTSLYHVSSQLESILLRKQFSTEAEAQHYEASLQVLTTLDELRIEIRNAQMPIPIASVNGTSPVFSYSDPLPPVPAAKQHNPWRRAGGSLLKTIQREGEYVLPQYVPVSRVVVELGHSGKWPGDLQAFRALKAAFLLQLADSLARQSSLPAQAFADHVHVLKNGFIFRIEIAHAKEVTLLRREIENGVVKYKESEESVRLQRECFVLPRLRGALHGLHQKHPAFGPTACLFKRWLSSHLLSPPLIPSLLPDLLTSAIFSSQAPSTPPRVPLQGFLRVLNLLISFDWSQPLVVDFSGDLTREEISSIENKFHSLDNKPAMFVATAHDARAECSPSEQVRERMIALARGTLKYLESGVEECRDHLLGAFIPSLAGYDVIIRLSPPLVPHSIERVSSPPKEQTLPEQVEDNVVPVVEFDVVERYLEELRSAYSEFCVFFHDGCGGDVIAALWTPALPGDKDFQVTNAQAFKPITRKGETTYKINVEAIIEDFRILGKGLVQDIVVN